jgi:hypothetical protein
MAMSFSEELLHLFMVHLALRGRFDIRLHYHGFVPHRASASGTGTQFFIPEHTVPACLTIVCFQHSVPLFMTDCYPGQLRSPPACGFWHKL